ncbi:Dynamin family [Aspergillus sclerotialis]|uniref:Dynamin family n=1 Tax=Aspergillus sclerotialis TaxID=2070753 RepID=A0A3A2ZU36_9EURO|nr:Dynamin family [Aspergillus sclerotialis]
MSGLPNFAHEPINMMGLPNFTTDSTNMAVQPGDSITLMTQDMKDPVKRIQDLRHLGIEDSRIALPKICVVSDQSTGKSSLIEGMSDIKVPRSAGTCTRCPMEINLSESEPGQPWTCRVFLSRKYIYQTSRRNNRANRTHPLGPWIEQEPEDEHFITLTEKYLVQDALKWAQLAILNPGQSPNDYVPVQNGDTDPVSTQVKFSPNVVRLDISAPDFPNLSFYDLPGVISLTEFDDESYVVGLVENLVKEYISHEDCIVLLTQTMTEDATNSSAARIIRDVKGAKDRTLGVLTKPDRIQSGESNSQWTEILNGEKFSLGHGYYVVKNNPDTRVEHSEARAEEAEFFSSGPWSTELYDYRHRFDTRNLQTALSYLLLEQIKGYPPFENVQYILASTLNHLKNEIRSQIDGGSPEYPLQKSWNHIAHDFQRSLKHTRPTVTLVTSVRTTVKRKSPDDSAPVAPAKKRRYRTEHFDRFNGPAKCFTWEEIRDINADSYPVGLPDQTDPRAIEVMNRLSVKHWDKPMNAFIRATHKLVHDTLMKQLDDVFSQYHQTGLYRELKRILETYMQGLREAHFRQVQEIYNIEYDKPFTLAKDAMHIATHEAKEYLKEKRFRARGIKYLNLQGKYAEDDPRREAELKKLTGAQLGKDKFVEELKMMAKTRAYYDIASARFVDSICQSTHTRLFSKCRDDLVNVIEKELGIFETNAMERCLELMTEDPDRQRRRLYLIKEKEKVSKAQEWLVLNKKGDDESDAEKDDTMNTDIDTIDGDVYA